jgi:hypothetical protein
MTPRIVGRGFSLPRGTKGRDFTDALGSGFSRGSTLLPAAHPQFASLEIFRPHLKNSSIDLATLIPMQYLGYEVEDWKPISLTAGIAWLSCYLLFLIYAATDRTEFLFLDYVNLIIHEGGHIFFGWMGHTIMILGGTLGELLVPMLCGLYFFWKREVSATAFCGFWFFENFLYIGVYMADARAQALPLVGGDEHDWATLFGQWGWLLQDRQIGAATRTLGWLGMVAAMLWLAFRAWRCRMDDQPQLHSLA